MPVSFQRDKPDEEGTEPPLPGNWSSPWISKSAEDRAKWLQEMPTFEGSEYYLPTSVRRDYFVALNKSSKEDDTMLVCRVKNVNGELRVDYLP
jgi:hypothetical protein